MIRAVSRMLLVAFGLNGIRRSHSWDDNGNREHIQEILVLLAKILTLEMSAVKDCLVVTDERELAVAVLNLSTELLSIHNMVGPPTTFHKLGQSLALASAGLQGGSQILGWL
eukprot:GHVQ01026410.1.p1 GENE.GHVQ01026410.1~~GHVQ01026410.1.p1  ORF type:complete len:112 (+),score=8.54 GHVQ01026410.1:647-982(+)